MSLGYKVNKEKNGSLVAYIASKVPNLNLRKMLKIVYLIDEQFMQLRFFPLTWFDYYAWAKGPVAPELYSIKNGGFSDYVECRKDSQGKYIVSSKLSEDSLSQLMEEYSPYEIKVIDQMIHDYGDKSADELTDITHQPDSLWSLIVKQKNIDFSQDKQSKELIPLSILNAGDSEREEIFNEAKWTMEFQDSLSR